MIAVFSFHSRRSEGSDKISLADWSIWVLFHQKKKGWVFETFPFFFLIRQKSKNALLFGHLTK